MALLFREVGAQSVGLVAGGAKGNGARDQGSVPRDAVSASFHTHTASGATRIQPRPLFLETQRWQQRSSLPTRDRNVLVIQQRHRILRLTTWESLGRQAGVHRRSERYGDAGPHNLRS